ncbi:sushi domain-containing protein 2-like [Dendronephthya gigantea]|uniref:sushi domain-containing protein 2-like n=1 Tax=Dendronephthya gigantea TaxID=151771 RepID=UPI00106CD5D2|nr:sushi domain-containing protein 2-like [Dendronephthya gigantea]
MDNPVLWNVKMTNYRRKDKKENIWEEQAHQMNKTVDILKGWFRSLRDTNTRLDKKKSGDSAPNLTKSEQWILSKFAFLKTVTRHRPEPMQSLYRGDLNAAESACAGMQDVLDEVTPIPSSTAGRSHKRPQDTESDVLETLQKKVAESGTILNDIYKAKQQPITARSVFANYVKESLLTMSKSKYTKARSSINRLLSELMDEDSDDEFPSAMAAPSIKVNTNGVISFLVEVSQFNPDPFPLGDNRRLIAPFWADIDTRIGGVVYYRETQELAMRTSVSNEIRRYFVRQRSFTAKWTMIVTWLDVARYRGRSNLRNTFQTILATDGVNSFAIFYYNKIEWTFGLHSSSQGVPAQAGFNAGDGVRYFNIPNSRTSEIINIISTSNYKSPGMWIFQVDGETVKNTGCASGRDLVLSPRSGIELGGTVVYIGGPCYNSSNDVVCRFNKNIESAAELISPEQAYCVTPPLNVTGLMPLELSLDGGITYNYTGTFRSIPIGRNPPDIEGLEMKQWVNSTKTVLTWDQTAINATHIDIEISQFDTFDFRLHQGSLTTFKKVPNSGSYALDFGKDSISMNGEGRRKRRNSNAGSEIAIVSITASSKRKKRFLGKFFKFASRIFSSPFLITSLLASEVYCRTWHGYQNRKENKRLRDELPPCPPRVEMIDYDRFKPDNASFLRRFFHPGSTYCIRSRRASESGAGQQCCYKGIFLLVGPPGGGTIDIVSPEKSLLGHFGRDVLPWLACCKLSFFDNCGKYYDARPSDDGLRFIPQPTAGTRGDPHLSTFDGTFYTFNGYGEYVLLKVNNGSDLEFQGRMIPILDNHGGTTRATALTAFVIKGATSDIVQFEFNNRRRVDVLVNGEHVEFDEQTRLDFTGVFIVKQNQSKFGTYFTSGVAVVVTSVEDFLNYQISVPLRFKGKTAGLLGFWNDDKDQEFLLPNGSFIDTNSSYRRIHNEFGQKWMVDRNQTIFTYHVGKSYDSFTNSSFIPVFLDETNSLFTSPALEQDARSVCGENEECLFDIAVTGKRDVGEATLQSFNEIQKRANASKLVAKRIFFGCDGVENSGKKVDFCGDCDGDNSSCTDCEGRIRPGFLKNETCGSYLPWSEWSVCIGEDEKGMRERNRTCSKEGHCLHLGENTQQEECKADLNDGYYLPWSEWSVCIGKGEKGMRERNRTCSKEGHCQQLGQNKQEEKCKTDDDDDDKKALKLYAVAIGIPVAAILLTIVITALVSCMRCYVNKKSSSAPGNSHVSNHQNKAYMM